MKEAEGAAVEGAAWIGHVNCARKYSGQKPYFVELRKS
jgi:hypothetical protein